MTPRPLREGMLVRCENKVRHYQGLYLKWHGENLCSYCVHEDGAPLDAATLHAWCTGKGGHFPMMAYDTCSHCGLSGKLIRVLTYHYDRNPQGHSETFANAHVRSGRALEPSLEEEKRRLLEQLASANAQIVGLEGELLDRESEEDADEDEVAELTRELFFTDPDVIAFVDQQMDVGLVKTAEQWGVNMAPRRHAGLERAWLLSQEIRLVAEHHLFDKNLLRMPEGVPVHPLEHGWRHRAEERAQAIVELRDYAPERPEDFYALARRLLPQAEVDELAYEEDPFLTYLKKAEPGTLFGIDRATDETRLAGVRLEAGNPSPAEIFEAAARAIGITRMPPGDR